MKGIQRPAHMDDLVASNISAFEKDLQQTQHLEAGNRRQLFKTRPCSLVEKASFDSDDGRVLNTSFQAKPSWHRKNGIQSSLIRGEQLLIQRTTGSTSSQGSGDLIAMGTLWNPGNNVSCNTTSKDSISGQTIGISDNHSFINKSLALGPQNTNGSSSNSNNNTINSHRKPANLRMNHNSSVSGISNTMFGLQLGINGNNSIRESKCIADPKYQDPLYGATASFQQRLMELASLEADTIRWERNKKVKKKSKPDKD
uniref:Uncharacterized protein n=1 Tax=Arion vulgaris TaxID=1028688 RepID=A0A0B7AMS4_9EUPU